MRLKEKKETKTTTKQTINMYNANKYVRSSLIISPKGSFFYVIFFFMVLLCETDPVYEVYELTT